MTVAGRLESRLRFGKLLVTFNLQPDLTFNVLETTILLRISKMSSAFFVLSILPKKFCSDLNSF